MKRIITTVLLCLSLTVARAQYNILPKPSQLMPGKGELVITSRTTVGAPADERSSHVARMFADQLTTASGMKVKTTRPHKGQLLWRSNQRAVSVPVAAEKGCQEVIPEKYRRGEPFSSSPLLF